METKMQTNLWQPKKSPTEGIIFSSQRAKQWGNQLQAGSERQISPTTQKQSEGNGFGREDEWIDKEREKLN